MYPERQVNLEFSSFYNIPRKTFTLTRLSIRYYALNQFRRIGMYIYVRVMYTYISVFQFIMKLRSRFVLKFNLSRITYLYRYSVSSTKNTICILNSSWEKKFAIYRYTCYHWMNKKNTYSNIKNKLLVINYLTVLNTRIHRINNYRYFEFLFDTIS